MRGLAYGRLSRDEDGEQESLKNQEEIVVGHMEKNGHTIIDIIMDDNYTGMHFDRPGIKRMFELAGSGEIEAVFVKNLSRLGRHRTLTLDCIDKLKLLGVRVISVTENNISNANLHLMFDKIVIEETEAGLNLDLRLKSPFISKKKEPLLKQYMVVNNEILNRGA